MSGPEDQYDPIDEAYNTIDRLKVQIRIREEALTEIVAKWVPALMRDCTEPDKTDCNALSIRSLIIRTLPGRNFP